MVNQKKVCIFLSVVGTFILVLSFLSTPIFLNMQIMQLTGTMLGAIIIGVSLVLMLKK